MNIEALKMAEIQFLAAYPGGFSHPDMQAIGKKHNVHKLADFCQEAFAKQKFNQPDELLDNWVKVIARSSMISLFEKPKFKSFVNTRQGHERKALAQSLYELLHGKQQNGFELQLDLLKQDKLAKWSIITAVPAYYRLDSAVFIKPTTAKGVIKHFELTDLTYSPMPTWDFYKRYSAAIMAMKKHVDPSLTINNPAFCGFLMMSLPQHN